MSKEEALLQLNSRFSNPKMALAAVQALRKKRFEEQYPLYWSATPKQVPVFEAFTPDIKIFGILGGNRCLAGNTPVATPSGSVAIKDIKVGDAVYAQDGSLTSVVRKYYNGPKELYRWHGKRRQLELYVDATEKHKVILADQKDNTGYLRPLGDLRDRDYFVRHDGIAFGEQEYPLALLIGLLLGDGYIAGHGIQWTCAEPELVELLTPYIESFGYKVRSRGIQHYISDPVPPMPVFQEVGTGRLKGTGPRHRLRAELARLGLLGKKSGDKFIPAEVWNWKKADVAQLLGGLIATDGSVYKGNGTWHLGYTSTSRDLIEGFQKLLAEGFGIYGSIISKGSKGSLGVTYGTAQAFERFAEMIPIPGRKGRLVRAATHTKRGSKSTLVSFVDKEPLGEQETYDIEVLDKSHIFFLSNNLQVSNSGKTELGTFIDIAWALGKETFRGEPAWDYVENLPIPEPPSNIWVVGLDFPTLRDVIWGEKFRRGRNHPALIPESSPYIQKLNDSDYQVFFKNGSVITGKSGDSGREKFQGASVDLIHIDEECEEDVFNECYQRTSDCAGKLLITLTPLTDIASGVRTPWVHDLYTDAERGLKRDVRFVRLSVLDNPFIPEDEKEKLKIKWAGHPEEKARLYGDFVQRSGLVYPMWDPKVHMVKRFKIDPKWRRVVSIDPAATGTTAAIWAAIEPGTNNLYLYNEYYESGKVPSEHAKNMLVRNAGNTIDIWLIDKVWGNQREPSDHKTGMQLYRDAGIPCRLAEVESDFGVLASLEYFNATLEPTSRHPKIYVFDDLHNFRKEIEGYVWASFDRGERQGQSKEKPLKRNDHILNAMQYLCAGKFKGSNKLPIRSQEELLAATKNQSYT